MRYSSERLREFHSLLLQHLAEFGPVRGLNSFGVDHERGVLSFVVRPEHDEEQLAQLLAAVPPDALSVDVSDEGPYFLM